MLKCVCFFLSCICVNPELAIMPIKKGPLSIFVLQLVASIVLFGFAVNMAKEHEGDEDKYQRNAGILFSIVAVLLAVWACINYFYYS